MTTSLVTEKLDWPGKLKWPETSVRYLNRDDWDRAFIEFLKSMATFLKPGFLLADSKTEDDRSESRDDNGAYYWQGGFIVGNQSENISITYRGDQGEQTVYALPMDERRTYKVNGLAEGQQLELICDFREYGASISWVILQLKVEADSAEAEKVRTEFFVRFSE